jgi:amidohydrolase
MKKILLLVLISAEVAAQNLPTQLPKYIQEVAPKVIEMRRYFHQYPELSNREFQTAAKIEAYMKE